MTFGYIGYIWAMSGCCLLSVVFGGSAAFLYGLGRRRAERDGEPTVTVEDQSSGSGPDQGGAA